MPVAPLQALVAAVLAGAVASVGLRARALSTSGALAAWIVGTIVFAVGSWTAAAPLLTFFVSASILTYLNAVRKKRPRSGTCARSWQQVVANGGLAAAILVAIALRDARAVPSVRDLFLLYVGVIAAASADTWSTECGGLLGRAPRMITTWGRMEAGVSGAVTLAGLIGGLLGACAVVIAATLAWPASSAYLQWRPDVAEMLAIAWAGFVASVADSVLGASVQARYRCAKCATLVEVSEHCGVRGRHVAGLRWVNNDAVNLISGFLGLGFCWYLLRAFAWTL